MPTLAPEIVWGLFPRLIGVLYVLAFGGLIPQILTIGGSRGFTPMHGLLARVRRDFPGPRRFLDYPTLLWIDSSDTTLRAVPWLGVGCGLCAIYGGPIGVFGLALGWMLWLSLEPLGLIYPWDTLLMEIGFVALFLPASEPLPSLHASTLPLPTVAFMCRWVVLRVMMGFAKDKFIGTTLRDSLYLRGFFVWMTLPTPLGWFGHHAPARLLKLALVFMFFAEVIAPLLGLFAGWPRLISFGALVSLMIGIQATGNWGYFNVGYALLCVCLLDTHSSLFDLSQAGSFWQFPEIAVHGLMLVLFLSSLFYLPLNSWTTRAWVHWPANLFPMERSWWRFSFLMHRVLAPLRAIAPLRIVNGYGVFPARSSSPLRVIPVFEGSDDGVTWKQYGYKHNPSFANQRPPIVAPHHPRTDHISWYAANSIGYGSLFGGLIPFGNPYLSYSHARWSDVVGQRLLAGDPLFVDDIGHNPFPNDPPKWIRVAVLAMTPTRPREMRATGHWWHVQRLGTFIPARTRQTWPDQQVYPEPELFHPDHVALKRRSAALRAVSRAFAAGASADEAAIAGSDLSAADLRQFWDELLPLLAENRGELARLHERSDALRARFSTEELYRLERVLERMAWLLRLRTESLMAAETAPGAALVSNFRYHMQLHALILDGRAAFQSYLKTPEQALARASAATPATQLWVLALMRYPQFMGHVCSFRWSEVGLRAHEQEAPGLFEFYELMIQIVPPDEQFRPQPVQQADGEYVIDGFYPPPDARARAASGSC